MGFSCGITLSDGRECLHDSRRKALACTRRLARVGEHNGTVAALTAERDAAVAAKQEALEKLNEATAALEGARKDYAELQDTSEAQAGLVKEFEGIIAGLKSELEASTASGNEAVTAPRRTNNPGPGGLPGPHRRQPWAQ